MGESVRSRAVAELRGYLAERLLRGETHGKAEAGLVQRVAGPHVRPLRRLALGCGGGFRRGRRRRRRRRRPDPNPPRPDNALVLAAAGAAQAGEAAGAAAAAAAAARITLLARRGALVLHREGRVREHRGEEDDDEPGHAHPGLRDA